MKSAVIYKIECLANGKVYIGSSIDFSNRWKCHRYHLNAGSHHSRPLQNAWNKYGESAFAHSIIEKCLEIDRDSREKHWIDALQATSSKYGYNVCPNPSTREGLPHTEETKLKMSLAQKGKPKSPEHIQKIINNNKGKVTSEETKKKLSQVLTGRRWTDEQKQRVRGTRVGWHHSDAAIQKMREAALGRQVSDETRKKLSDIGKGRKWTPEQRGKILAHEKAPMTLEQRFKLSKAKGGQPFVVTSADGNSVLFNTLAEAKVLGLDPSNIQKCLIGKAKSTKGYTCHYYDVP